VGSGTGSTRSPERDAALHRLRSTLARLKAELELAEADGTAPPVERLLEDLDEAFALLTDAEDVDHPRPHVLVVDDDERLAEVTARSLRRHGFDASSTASLRDLSRGQVLVIDLGLLDGLDAQTLDAVRAARPIVVTGATDRAAHALATRVAAFDYLVKPVELEDLAAAISRRLAEG
jgi:CheY-like chemotaxis protein